MKLRYYQADAIRSFFKYYDDGNVGNPLIAMPTGTGKSLVIACLICEIIRQFPSQRILKLTHVKELISQNYKTLLKVWPNCPAGIYSAGLERKDAGFPITYAGIGSIHKKAHIFQKIDVVIIDEVHLVSQKGATMYRKFLEELKRYNRYVIVIGLTATPFRLGQGMLTNGELFDAFCYDITNIEGFNRLLREGFLAPLIPLRVKNEMDLEGLGIVNGDFNNSQMEERFAVDEKIIKAIEEAIVQGYGRKRWLIFATGVESCQKIARLLTERYGINCRPVHSNTKEFPMTDAERDANIAAFKRGEIQALVNNNVLTTGFDDPMIDLILMLRPTCSPGLWVQMLGRGTRPVWPERDGSNWHLWPPGYVAAGRYDLETIEGRLLCIKEGPKLDCMVLDFAGNTKRLGPINDPVIPYPKTKKGPKREAPVKICDNCGMYNHASVRICSHCGTEFPRNVKLAGEASNEELIKSGDAPIIIEVVKVTTVTYDVHSKSDKPDSFKVTYQCGLLKSFRAWWCFEHPEPSAHDARQKWRKAAMTADDPPKTALEAIVRTNELKRPTHIRVRLDTKHPQVMDIDYTGTAFGSIEPGAELPTPPEDPEDDIPF